jgi:peptidoglycan/LPS O-acetylase OafA/YrhL
MDSPVPTLQGKLASAGDRPSGFDYLRLALATSIIAWHGVVVCYGFAFEASVWQGPIGPFVWFLVPSFFALSGFLVMGSLYRNDLVSFLVLRGLRILPALAVELVLSAFIIGGLLTTLAASAYFTDSNFFAYFGNLIGIVRYNLPGVFQHMPIPAVNLQLWTIPYELDCYIALPCLALLGLHKRPTLLLGLAVGLGVVLFGFDATMGPIDAPSATVTGNVLVLSFLCGAALFALRDRVPASGSLFPAAIILAWTFLRSRDLHYLSPLPVAYATIYLGLLNPRRLFVLRGADYSYGLYLYGFPVQQTVAFLFPDSRIWAVNVVASLAVASCFAALSWHFIEARVLASRHTVLAFVGKTNGYGQRPKAAS